MNLILFIIFNPFEINISLYLPKSLHCSLTIKMHCNTWRSTMQLVSKIGLLEINSLDSDEDSDQ